MMRATRKTSFALATAAFLSSAAVSMAQELPESLRPIGNLSGPYNLLIPNYDNTPSIASWQGFYIKPNIGYSVISFDNSLLKDADGFTIGVSGGYDFLQGHLLFGPTLDVNVQFLERRCVQQWRPVPIQGFRGFRRLHWWPGRLYLETDADLCDGRLCVRGHPCEKRYAVRFRLRHHVGLDSRRRASNISGATLPVFASSTGESSFPPKASTCSLPATTASVPA